MSRQLRARNTQKVSNAGSSGVSYLYQSQGRKRAAAAVFTPQPITYSVPDNIPSLSNIVTNYEDVVDVVKNDGTIDYSRALAMVVVRSQGSRFRYVSNDRIKVYDLYESRLPFDCLEGRKGQQLGSWHVDSKHVTPGIPDRKFSFQDAAVHGIGSVEWIIQDVMINPDIPTQCLVYYQGWSSYNNEYLLTADVQRTSKELLKISALREKFLNKLAQTDKKLEPWVKREMFPQQKVVDNELHRLWRYKDLSFYHSELHADNGLGPVLYFCLKQTQVLPPNFAYSLVNVLHEDAYLRCLGHPANETIKDVIPGVVPRGDNVGACENLAGCKCNYKAKIVYDADENGTKGVVLLHHNQEGVLDTDKFDYEKANVVVECSDACGCSDSCPRRTLQSSKWPPLAVMHKTNLGFCIQAMQPIKKGSLITEYTGEVMFTKPEMLPAADPRKIKRRNRGKQFKLKNPIEFRLNDEVKEATIELHGNYEQDYGDNEDVEFLPTGRSDEYEATFGVLDQQMIICAEKVGNVARFLSHSCNPNATFIETFSRRYEKDAYCPRIAVYAIGDIEEGEMITIRYYADENMKEKTSRKCFCQEGCIHYLPEIRKC